MSFSLGDQYKLNKDYDIAKGERLGDGSYGLTIIILILFI